MTERERWVVYPLLFLALGAALRDKLVDRTTTKSIVCQELTILDEGSPGQEQGPRMLAHIGPYEAAPNTPSVGRLVINGKVEVHGLVDIDGAINSRQYGIQGLPFIPGLPNVAMPDVLRAIQQSQSATQNAPPSNKKPDSNSQK